MKILTLLVSLFLSLSILPAQQKAIQTEAALQLVFENIVHTAYVSIHGTAEGFDPSSVSCSPLADEDVKQGDLSPWVSYSQPFRSRLGMVRMMNEKGKLYHVWPSLLSDKRAAKLILLNHYAG